IRVDLTETPEARGLVERFAWTARTELPFVTLKMAMSVDGFIAPHGGITHSLTGSQARERVRELRIDHDAVMVGAGTVRIDDPRLTVRPHATRRKPYVRVVACESAPIAPTARVLATPQEAPPDAYARTIVLAPAGARDRFAPLESIADVAYAGSADAHVLDLGAALRVLRARGVATVLCEGGPTLAARLLAARLVQRIVWLIAPVLLRSDAAIPVLSGGAVGPYAGWRFDRTERLGDDMLLSANIECSPG
ncbi:MAG: RibD family protein, partial [Candidatus Eremiobacteraeota bacterium]|nr:RibD family protein [Candidatus Eremiobacteraeota bacterium]